MTTTRSNDLLTLTAGIVAAHLAGNAVQVADLPLLIAAVHHALSRLNPDALPSMKGPQPAVPIRSSVRRDHLVCLTDDRKPKTLRHRLTVSRAMTRAEHRTTRKLPSEYSTVAPVSSGERSEIASDRRVADEVTINPRPRTDDATEMATATSMPATPATPATPPARRKLLTLFKPDVAEAEQTTTAGKADLDLDARAKAKDARDDAVRGPLAALCEAIERRTCVTATYNRADVTLAPHLLFIRHDERYLRAVTMMHDGRRPREVKLGTFKLAGLGAVTVTTKGFSAFPDYPSILSEYGGDVVRALSWR